LAEEFCYTNNPSELSKKWAVWAHFLFVLANMAGRATSEWCLEELVRKAVGALGYFLADLEISNRGKQLRIFIEKSSELPEPGGGITVTDCEAVSRHLQRVFEVDGIDYERLEVSSPGLDRKLKTSADFSRFSGFEADVHLRILVDGRRHVSGTISEVTDGQVKLNTVDGFFAFDIANLKRARLVPKL
jgi:ribosome maturation factor RimP